MPQLPSIVMLHYVSDDESLAAHKPWLINTASFTRLLDHLEEEGYRTITFSDIVNATADYRKKGKKIILTFDDCAKHLWHFAIPELKQRNMRAVFYMPTAELNGYNVWNEKDGLPQIPLMDKEDMQQLAAIGMEVGSHAHHHEFLELKNKDEVVEELTKSKAILEQLINKKVLTIAYPYGSMPANCKRLVKDAGYEYGVSVYAMWDKRYTLRRWNYDDTISKEQIAYHLSSKYSIRRSFKDKQFFFKTKVLQKAYKRYAAIKLKFKS